MYKVGNLLQLQLMGEYYLRASLPTKERGMIVQFRKGQKLFERPEIYIQHEYLVQNVGCKVIFENDCCGPLLLRRFSKLLRFLKLHST